MTIDDLVERIKDAVGTEKVFAPAQTHDGVTVIPAVSLRAAGGGGSGRGGAAEEGEGGGFAVTAKPAGAIVVNNGQAAWRAPLDLNRIVLGAEAVLIAYFAFSWLKKRSVARAPR